MTGTDESHNRVQQFFIFMTALCATVMVWLPMDAYLNGADSYGGWFPVVVFTIAMGVGVLWMDGLRQGGLITRV